MNERIAYDGSLLEPLDEESVRTAVAELAAEGVESIAVLCLFSLMKNAQEERIAVVTHFRKEPV